MLNSIMQTLYTGCILQITSDVENGGDFFVFQMLDDFTPSLCFTVLYIVQIVTALVLQPISLQGFCLRANHNCHISLFKLLCLVCCRKSLSNEIQILAVYKKKGFFLIGRFELVY